MTNVKLLSEKIKDSGMTVTSVAKKAGIVRETLYNRMKVKDFKASEIVALSSVLQLNENERNKIFFDN